MPLYDVSTLRGFLKELGFTFLGAGLAIGSLFLLGFLRNNNVLGLGILDSQGSLLIAALLLLEFLVILGFIVRYYYFD